jgi:hypothetical protein
MGLLGNEMGGCTTVPTDELAKLLLLGLGLLLLLLELFPPFNRLEGVMAAGAQNIGIGTAAVVDDDG